ncbi:restriction endonuclease subunit S [Limosilactobacillus reuteri]|uniref:restriction endonuclease subunit S n=1 Tax=Limosilactobacillus reuteri TaxID=1598 RepID=UPI00298CF04D|nr:restriction endonuclease subunit S [Limosilactobacillus reuteri]
MSLDWEQRKLSDIADVYDGTHQTPNYKNAGIMFLSVENIKTLKSEKYISEQDFKNNFKISPEKGDVLMTRIGDVGTANVVESNEPIAFYVSLALLKTRSIDSYFLCSSIESPYLQSNIRKRTLITAIPQKINKDEIGKVNINVPDKREQVSIGTLFKTLNKAITLQQRKLDQLNELKKALLQKMLSNGKLKPTLRFKEFSDNWKQYKLGQVAKIVGGGTPSTKNSKYWDGSINWYSPVEINDQVYTANSQRKITEIGLKKSSARLLPVGTVLFTSRAGIGNTAILTKEACTNQGFQSIVPDKDKLDSYFIYSMTAQLKRYGETHGAGSTFIEVSGKEMAKMPIVLPSYSEQLRISSIFSKIDITISTQQNKIDKLNSFKKSLLQNMFI